MLRSDDTITILARFKDHCMTCSKLDGHWVFVYPMSVKMNKSTLHIEAFYMCKRGHRHWVSHRQNLDDFNDLKENFRDLVTATLDIWQDTMGELEKTQRRAKHGIMAGVKYNITSSKIGKEWIM